MNVMVNNKNLSKYGEYQDAVKNFRQEMEKGKESMQYVLCKL